ncbi:hypothetical protein N9L33_01340 [Nitrospinae bacterium]|nr:hypothetical protein [Nitrospinota bacterium]
MTKHLSYPCSGEMYFGIAFIVVTTIASVNVNLFRFKVSLPLSHIL